MRRQLTHGLLTLATLAVFVVSCSDHENLSSFNSVEQLATEQAPLFLSEGGFNEDFDQYVLPLWSEAERSYFVGRRDKNLFYVKYAHPSPKAAVLLVNGFTENSLKYRELAYNFFQRGFTVYTYDHRGQGFSDRITSDPQMIYVERWDEYVQDLRIFLNEVVRADDLPVFAFAHSMGGAIVADFLQQDPSIFEAVVLSSPLLQLNTEPYPALIAKAIAGLGTLFWQGEQYAPGQGPVNYENWIVENSGTSSAQRFERNKSDTMAVGIEQSGASLKWVMEVLVANNRMNLWWNARKVSTPVRMYQAALDTYVLPGGQVRFCESAPGCELIVIEGSKHEIYHEINPIRTPYLLDVFEFFEGFLN